jgi:hypothetical protein
MMSVVQTIDGVVKMAHVKNNGSLKELRTTPNEKETYLLQGTVQCGNSPTILF